MSTTLTKIDKTKIPVAEIGNALTSISDDHILGTAGDIYDTDFHGGAYQNEINKYLDHNFSNYLPLSGGIIRGKVEIWDEYTNPLITLGSGGITLGSGAEEIIIGSGNSGISIGSGKISIGSGELSIGTKGITIGTNGNYYDCIELSIDSGNSGISIGSALQIGTGGISIGSGDRGINIGSGEINIGIGTSAISMGYAEISIGDKYSPILRISAEDKEPSIYLGTSGSASQFTIGSEGIITKVNIENGVEKVQKSSILTGTSILFEDKDTNESNEFNIHGVKYPLTVLYRDVENNPVEFEYKAGSPVEGDINMPEVPGNNSNTIDLSRGVYYATTSKTATRVSNELTIRTGDGEDDVITYNGQEKQEIDITPEGIGAAPADHNHDDAYADKEHTHSYAGSKSEGGPAEKVEQKLTLNVNGNNTEFDGSEAKTVNINATSVGAAPATHDHDTVYSKLGHDHDGTYSKLEHTHSYAGSKSEGGPAEKVEQKLTLNVNGNNTEFDGSEAKTVNINATSVGAAPASHNHDDKYSKLGHDHDNAYSKLEHKHNYAGSKSAGGPAEKVEQKLTLNVNGNNTEFDGSEAKTVNINATSVGAAPASHNHDDKYSKLGHDHNGTYADKEHYHDDRYSKIGHDHDTVYSKLDHDHDDVYAKKDWVEEELSHKLGATDKAVSAYTADSASTAETANIANKVASPLTLKQGNSVINYDGQLKEIFDVTPLKEITYRELKTLKDNNELIPGQQYRITDFVTTTNGDGGTNSAGNAFDIIVEAKSTNELSENAKACKTKFTNLYSLFNNYNLDNINTVTSQYYVNNTVGPTNWTGVELDKIPSGILNLSDLTFVPSTNTDIRTIKLSASGSHDLNLLAGRYWVLVNYTSGAYKLNTVGAELVAQGSDTVISSDYHIGYTGTYYSNRLYCLDVPEDGIYNIKCYIIAHPNYDNGVVDATVAIQAGRFNNNINNFIPFKDNNLSAWELKYSIENTSSIVNWVKSDGKGHIYYMKDEFNNECNYDFKNIRYDNYYTFDYEIDGKHIDGSSVYGNLCYNNVISMDVSGANGKLGFAKIYFKNTDTNAQCHSNRILHDNWEITFGNNCYDNYIGEKSQFITIGNNCYHNIIKCNSQYITFNNDCYSNIIETGCDTITFGTGCHSNIIKCSSKSITLNNDCYSNIIGIGCETITFGASCRNNILNDGCLRNTFESQCIANTLDNDCNDNTFGSQCCDNKLGRLSSNNSFGAGCSSNIFGTNCIHNKFAGSCSSNIFKDNCTNNIFNLHCDSNVFGSGCVYNEFGNECYDNIFKDDCGYSSKKNIFGDYCYANEFGKMCRGIVFGNNGSQNKFGNYCWDNKFGNNVSANKFGIDCSNIEIRKYNSEQLLDYICGFEFGNYCRKLYIYPSCEITPAYKQELQNFKFSNDLGSTSQYTNIVLEGTAENLLYRKYITNIGKNSSGELIQKCLMDTNVYETYNNGKLTISIM